ncbi:CD1375 family protein [Clostridium botulinum]|nr:CD1375 family protein [Clostridium botulinum]
MNDFILNMYVVAVQSERFTIDFVPFLYRKKVAEILEKEVKK